MALEGAGHWGQRPEKAQADERAMARAHGDSHCQREGQRHLPA